jgi:DNA-binding Xre family transcriptional regulator
MEPSVATASNLRAAMGRRNMTKAELARRLGENEMWVGRRVNGAMALTVDDLARICEVLEVELSDIVAVAAS